MSSRYKLTYFDARGRAELIRLTFTAGGATFEEKRFGFDEWPAIKPTTPCGSVPVLELDGKPYVESGALARVLARKLGLTGKNEPEEFVIEAIVTQGLEILNKNLYSYLFCKDETKKKELRDSIQKDVDHALPIWETKSKESGGPFFAKSGLSLADLAVFDLLDQLEGHVTIAWDKFPHLKGVLEAVKKHPKIAPYLSKRKYSLFF